MIDALFAIDAEARTANLDHAARHTLRSKKAPPLLAEIKLAITAARATALPTSALGKAANYTLALWPKLTRFLEYPELELSNNLAENSMRPSQSVAKTGSTSAARKPDPKLPPSFLLSKPAEASTSRCEITWLRSCPATPTTQFIAFPTSPQLSGPRNTISPGHNHAASVNHVVALTLTVRITYFPRGSDRDELFETPNARLHRSRPR